MRAREFEGTELLRERPGDCGLSRLFELAGAADGPRLCRLDLRGALVDSVSKTVARKVPGLTRIRLISSVKREQGGRGGSSASRQISGLSARHDVLERDSSEVSAGKHASRAGKREARRVRAREVGERLGARGGRDAGRTTCGGPVKWI